jgi:drug/metabolite transporter (DMT)-like permease
MDKSAAGWVNGLIGMTIFSGSLPATKIAMAGFDPLFLTTARAAIAGLIAVALLAALAPRRPDRADIGPLLTVACGVVVGYPLLSAAALNFVTSAHAVVLVGLLPIATAVFGVLRAGERPGIAFWVFAAAGSVIIATYALAAGAAAPLGDGLMLAAVVVCGLGYAEGARLSRRLGGWQVISWALVLALPLTLPLGLMIMPVSMADIGWPPLAALAYVSLLSMLLGFVFWYRGLALGGIAAVGQLQLLQPFLGLLLSALLLHDPVGWPLIAAAAGVAICVAGARRFAR